MKSFLNKFKIPTLLGLTIILIGIISGVYLSLRSQTLLSTAAPSAEPENITVTNIEDTSVVISWQTLSPSVGFVTFGQNNPSEQTVLDDRDSKQSKTHLVHYVTIKNLTPQTTYQFKVVSGKFFSKTSTFITATPSEPNGFQPIIGSVLDGTNLLSEGIAFLSISDSVIQSSLIKTHGNFLIPLSNIRKSDLKSINLLGEEPAKITIISAAGKSSAAFKLSQNGITLPPLKIGESSDLTNITPSPTPNVLDLTIYDLNDDEKINAADYSIGLKNKDKQINTVKKSSTSSRLIDNLYLSELTNKINDQQTK